MSRYLSVFACQKCGETFNLAGPIQVIEAVKRHVNDGTLWIENVTKEWALFPSSTTFINQVNAHRAICDGIVK